MSKNGKKYDHDVGIGRTTERKKPEWRKSELDRVRKYNDGQERRRNYKYGDKLPITGNNPRPAVIDSDIKKASARVKAKKKAASARKKK